MENIGSYPQNKKRSMETYLEYKYSNFILHKVLSSIKSADYKRCFSKTTNEYVYKNICEVMHRDYYLYSNDHTPMTLQDLSYIQELESFINTDITLAEFHQYKQEHKSGGWVKRINEQHNKALINIIEFLIEEEVNSRAEDTHGQT